MEEGFFAFYLALDIPHYTFLCAAAPLRELFFKKKVPGTFVCRSGKVLSKKVATPAYKLFLTHGAWHNSHPCVTPKI